MILNAKTVVDINIYISKELTMLMLRIFGVSYNPVKEQQVASFSFLSTPLGDPQGPGVFQLRYPYPGSTRTNRYMQRQFYSNQLEDLQLPHTLLL